MPRLSSTLASAIAVLVIAPVFAQNAPVTGTVTYRERVAMTETAVLEVALEDVSRADADAVVVARSRTENPGQPPFKFELAYDAGRIDARRRYAVRARILDGDRLMFTTSSAPLVITQGHGTSATVVMHMVPSAAASVPAPAALAPPAGRGRGRGAAAAAPQPPAPLTPPVALTGLPATFTGTLPCADCQGIRYQLNLLPDDSFVLRTTSVGRATGATVDDIGTWVLSSDKRLVVLKGSREQVELFSIRDAQTLRKLDAEGREIAPVLSHNLRRAAALQPIEIRMMLRGAYRDGPDGRSFTECSSGQRWPIAAEGAHRDLDSAYREAARRPGDALIISVEGVVQNRQGSPSFVVDRLHNAWPRETCEMRFVNLPLETTYWRLSRVGGDPVVPPANQRNEAALTFRAEPRTFSGSGGCNRLAGKYELMGDSITMHAAGTMMACPTGPPTEALFAAALRDTRRYRIMGRVLELFNDRHEPVARFDGIEK